MQLRPRHLFHLLSPESFSILGRIGGDATPERLPDVGDLPHFQYPRSDRRRCNMPDWYGRSSMSQLSVSSVGSEAMQPPFHQGSQIGKRPFSILGRIGGDATIRPGHLQDCQAPCFQYPRSDRRRCNLTRRPAGAGRSGLSVSSVGSEAMQLLVVFDDLVTARTAFSILGRIGGDATPRHPELPPPGRTLSVSSVGSEAMQPTLNC